MAKFSSVNINTATNGGCARMFALQQVLVAAGWVVKASSDGTTYKATDGSQITTASSGAGGMNNNSAWFRIQDPGGRREFCVQRGTNDRNWRITYSALDKFVGGSPSATVVPSATDSQILYGAGTDGAPSYSTFAGTVGTYYGHVVAQSTPEGDVYPFWSFQTDVGSGNSTYLFWLEPLVAGSFPAADADPCLVMCEQSAPSYNIWPKGWYKMNEADESFVQFPPLYMAASSGGGIGAGSYAGSNPYTGNDDMIPVCFSRGSGLVPCGWKGVSKYIVWKTVNRNYPDTVNLATDAYVYLGEMLFPWENGTAPSL